MSESVKYLEGYLKRLSFEKRIQYYLHSDKCMLDNDMFNNMIIENIRDSFIRKHSYKLYDLNKDKYLKTEQEKFFDNLKYDDSKIIECFVNLDYICKEFQDFICFYVISYTKYLINKLFRNSKFIDDFYSMYIEGYLSTNLKCVRNNVVSHISLEAIIDPLFTGMLNYIKSNQYVILYKTHYKKCIEYSNRLKTGCKNYHFDNELFDDWFRNEFSELIFKKVMLHILFVSTLIYIDNHKNYKVLDDLIKDCEMSYSRKLSVINNKYEVYLELNSILESEYDKLYNDPSYGVSIKSLIYKYQDIFKEYCGVNKEFGTTLNNLIGLDTTIDLLIYEKFIIDSGFKSNLCDNIDKANKTLKIYAEYNISEHYRDIVSIDPMYKTFMSVGLSIIHKVNNNEVKNDKTEY